MKRTFHPRPHSRIDNHVEGAGELFNMCCKGLLWLGFFTLLIMYGSPATEYPDTRPAEASVGRMEQPAINPMLPKLIMVESSGNPNAVSKKGARGLTQVMPATAKNPGYGIKPMRNMSVAEQKRFGNDYLNTMQKKYGSPVLAAAAYNAGAGTVDRALKKAKGNTHVAIKHLPAETQQYVVKVAGYRPPQAEQQMAMSGIPERFWEGK